MTTKTRHHYAFRYNDGKHTTYASAPGTVAGDVHRFPTVAERDDWVDGGYPYAVPNDHTGGFRVAITTRTVPGGHALYGRHICLTDHTDDGAEDVIGDGILGD